MSDVAKTLLRVANIETYYGAIQALRSVTIEVREGSIVTVLGANGAGKTTLLRTISGAMGPDRGKIWFDGEEIHGLSPDRVMRRGICHVPEGREIFSSLTVRQNLMMGAYTRRASELNAHSLDTCFDYFPILRERAQQRAGLLSGGEQQMLAIARALMGKPKLLLLDEPSLGLSPLLTTRIFEIIRRINREQRVAILLVEQNSHVALDTAEHAYILELGRVVMDCPCADLKASDDIREFYLGQSTENRDANSGNRRAETWL